MIPAIDRRINVTRESTWCEQRRKFRVCFSNQPEPKWITMAELFHTLTSGEPGEYILEGA